MRNLKSLCSVSCNSITRFKFLVNFSCSKILCSQLKNATRSTFLTSVRLQGLTRTKKGKKQVQKGSKKGQNTFVTCEAKQDFKVSKMHSLVVKLVFYLHKLARSHSVSHMKGGWKVIQSNNLVYYELFVFTTSSVYIV